MRGEDILAAIVADKRVELETSRRTVPEAELRARIAALEPCRDFVAALREPGVVRVIAEVKKASPSVGVLREDFDPVVIALAYHAAGAAAISVLTDAKYFQGSPTFLSRIREMVPLPLLRKDFVIDRYQLLEARAWGADAALLIVAILTPDELADLYGFATELGLAVLVETHTAEEIGVAVELGARVIGINNRDLRVFETHLETTLQLRSLVPADRVLVSESGIRTPADIRLLREHGVAAALIGEALMGADDIAEATAAMVAAGRG